MLGVFLFYILKRLQSSIFNHFTFNIMFNSLFTFGIFLMVFMLLFYCAKTIFDTQFLMREFHKTDVAFQEKIVHEHLKLQNSNQKIQILDSLHKSLFQRLFQITRDIILTQKLIFENRHD